MSLGFNVPSPTLQGGRDAADAWQRRPWPARRTEPRGQRGTPAAPGSTARGASRPLGSAVFTTHVPARAPRAPATGVTRDRRPRGAGGPRRLRDEALSETAVSWKFVEGAPVSLPAAGTQKSDAGSTEPVERGSRRRRDLPRPPNHRGVGQTRAPLRPAGPLQRPRALGAPCLGAVNRERRWASQSRHPPRVAQEFRELVVKQFIA